MAKKKKKPSTTVQPVKTIKPPAGEKAKAKKIAPKKKGRAPASAGAVLQAAAAPDTADFKRISFEVSMIAKVVEAEGSDTKNKNYTGNFVGTPAKQFIDTVFPKVLAAFGGAVTLNVSGSKILPNQ
jgi:hypothetical protein